MTPKEHSIRYIVLSDLHLGDKDSLLTRLDLDGEVDSRGVSPALEALVEALRDLVRRTCGGVLPTIVLNGDAVELAYGSVGGALSTFEQLASALLDPAAPVADGIVLIPGNHDHHLWEMARETQYRIEVADSRPSMAELPSPRHVTRMAIGRSVPSRMLNTVLEARGGAVDEESSSDSVRVLYPNMALVDDRLGRAVVIHHGHYVEPLYHFFSRVRRLFFPDRPQPTTVAEIEEENFAWVDFVWSLFGRSGGAGKDVERVFDMLLYPERTRALAAGLAERVAPVVQMPFLPTRWLRQFVLRHVFLRVAEHMGTERTRFHVVCSDGTIEGIQRYLFGPALTQLNDEFGDGERELTFLFGHTHKPFERVLASEDGSQKATVFNSGGWTIDTLSPDPAFGASILLIGEELDVVSIRVFNDGPDGRHFRERVLAPDGGGTGAAFLGAMEEALVAARESASNPWDRLGRALRQEVDVRRGHIRARRYEGS